MAHPKKKIFIKEKTVSKPKFEVPEHVNHLSLILKNNAEIRRFTALSIINYLTQTGKIKGDKKYIVFKTTKFTVFCDGMNTDYKYTEEFFIDALVGSFTSFANMATTVINEFLSIENDKNTNKEVVTETSTNNE